MGTLKEDMAKTLGKVTGGWREAMKQADRQNRPRSYGRVYYYSDRVTIKRVAFKVMEAAYNKASSNGRYYANARQIFYAARPLILAEATAEEVSSVYFTQTLLKDYIEQKSPSWKIVWDARGHFREPYSEHPIGLGGADVLEYIQGWRDPDVEFDTPSIAHTVGTRGPRGRYHGVLFIEKEGFDELLAEEHFAERYDIAITSTKGIPVKALCDLLSSLSDIPVYVAHDLDKAGFTIIETLRRGTRLAKGREVINLGLRLTDAGGLASESVKEVWSQEEGGRAFLRRRGATDEEIDLLVRQGQRIELNAMTSEQFVTWLNAALLKAGAKKYIPNAETLKAAYRRAVIGHRFEEKIEELNEAREEEQGTIKAPKGLKAKLQETLKKHPAEPWDSIIWNLAEGHDEEEDTNET